MGASGSTAHANGERREIYHSVIRDARMSGRYETLPTSHHLTLEEVLYFSPHPAIYVSLWISEQTAIISLYSVNQSDFVMTTSCVLCEVRT